MLLGLSQENLADRIGLTFQQVQKYEKGTNRIGASRLFELANALGVNVQYFYDDIPGFDALATPPGFAEGNRLERIDISIKSRDGIDLNQAFARISNVKVRRSIVELVRAIADGDINDIEM